MTEMTAFERQLSGEMTSLMGPVHSVDDAAIFAAIAGQSRRWRLPTMFSALKLAVAALVVALFGGFLLTGVLTQQPSDESTPAVGVSPSSVPTESPTVPPEPTEDADQQAATEIRSDILPGVDLVTEEVEPGAYRVLGDGLHDLTEPVQAIALSAEGDVWLELGTPKDWYVVRLGEPGVSRSLGRKHPWGLGVRPGGGPLMFADGKDDDIREWDGGAWVPVELNAYEECVMRDDVSVGPDGGCWTSDDEGVAHTDPDGSRTEVTRAEMGLDGEQQVGPPALAPDGAIWIPFGRGVEHGPEKNGGAFFDGLARYDGSTWTFVPYDGDEAVLGYLFMAVDANGVVWVSRHVAGVKPILSWDGESWTSLGDELLPGGPGPLPVEPWPDGTVRLGSSVRWDGSRLEAVEPIVPWDQGWPRSASTDGSLWKVIQQQLYVIPSKP